MIAVLYCLENNEKKNVCSCLGQTFFFLSHLQLVECTDVELVNRGLAVYIVLSLHDYFKASYCYECI